MGLKKPGRGNKALPCIRITTHPLHSSQARTLLLNCTLLCLSLVIYKYIYMGMEGEKKGAQSYPSRHAELVILLFKC